MVNVPLIKNRAMGLRAVALEPKFSSPAEKQEVLTDKERRIFVSIFSFLAVMAVIGGFFLWQKNLTTGFSLNREQLANFVSEIGIYQPSSETNLSAVISPSKDTDGDELTDVEEINIYKTNPYNADSDSDEISDALEIQKGTDPNCPEGKICQGVAVIGSNASSTADVFSNTDDLWNNLLTSGDQVENDLVSASSATALQLGNLPVSELRQLLKNAGAKDEDLNKLTDAQLQVAWQEFLNSQKQ